MEMGTGKSKIVVDTVGLLHEVGEVNAILIVAPKGVFHNWVRKEIPAHLPDRIKRTVLAWQPNITKKFKDQFKKFVEADELKIFVMNVEAFSTQKG